MCYKKEFEEMFSLSSLLIAYKKALKGKKYKKETYDFSQNLITNLNTIHDSVLSFKYKFGPYNAFTLYDNKKRYIVSTPFDDRIVHWILYQYLERKFEKTFIYDSYGNRKGKGTHKGVQRAKKFMQKKQNTFVLKIDYSKYFYSIHHSVLIDELKKKVNNIYVLRLLEILITSYKTPNIFNNIFKENSNYLSTKNKGMPIGSLTSQIFANIYLNKIDHYIKDYLKIKHYIRYVDDLIIFTSSKEQAVAYLKLIRNYSILKLNLEINPKKISLCPLKKALDFLGYRIFKYKILPRKSTQHKVRIAMFNKKFLSLVSYLGLLKNTHTVLALYVNIKYLEKKAL